MRTTITTRLRRPLRASALAAALAAICAPAAHAEDLPPQSIDANAEFLAYAGPPPVPGRVCVVDTGVDLTTDAAANVEARYSIYGGTLDDVGGSGIAKHGTYVAGIVASRLDGHGSVGIWPQAKVISVRVFPDGSSGTSVSAYLLALDTCRLAGATVINLSLSGLGTATGPELAELENRIGDYRVNENINIVAGAGNNGGEIGYPARFPRAFAVGASDAAGNLCSFSSRGPELDISAFGCGVHVSQPGGQVAVGGGTSFSTPVVTAALAALRAYSPGMSAQTAESVLLATARTAGAGKILDVGAAFHNAGLQSVLASPRPVTPAQPARATAPTITVLEAPGASDPLAELGVRTPRLRSRSYRRGVLRIAVSGVPDFGRAIFTVDGHRYSRASGRLRLRLHRAPRHVSVLVDIPGVGRTKALTVTVKTAGRSAGKAAKLKRRG